MRARGRQQHERGVMLETWQEAPHNRRAFQRVDAILPTALLPRGAGPTLPLRRAPLPLELDRFLARSFTDAILVARGREVVYERYLNGMTPATRHLLMSVSKSLCGVLAGRLVAARLIDVDATVSRYVPALAASAYGSATLRQVLDMTASVVFSERYGDPASEVQAQDRAAGWRPRRPQDPPDSYAFLQSLRPAGPHGRAFQYCSAGTDVLAWVVERVTGRRYAAVLAEEVWSRLGAEHDAFVTVDAAGFPAANGGVCATLRDLARFGRAVLDADRGRGGDTLVPGGWVRDIRQGGDPALADAALRRIHPGGSYRSQWWVAGDDHGSFYAHGIYGQYLWLDPTADVVVAKLSSLPEPDDPDSWREHVATFRTICDAIA